MTTRETALAVLQDLDAELQRVSTRGASALTRLAVFANVADALQFIVAPQDHPWLHARLDEVVTRYRVPVSSLVDIGDLPAPAP